MKIAAQKSKYHRFSFTYDYTPDRVEFCRSLKDSFGWQKFSFNPELKSWVFSDSLFISVIQEKFPQVIIDPNVEEIVKVEQLWLKEQREKSDKIVEVKNKKDTDFNVSGLKKELYPYQKVGVEFLVASGGRAVIADQMGCVSGDAILQVMRAKRGFKITLRDLYLKFNGVKGHWDKNFNTSARSLKGNFFGQQKINKVLFKGTKKTIKIVTESGKLLSLTPDHKVLTSTGEWKAIGKFKQGDQIIVNGHRVIKKWCNTCKEKTERAVSEYLRKHRPKNYGKCKKCIYRFFRKNKISKFKELKRGESYDKNGYILVSSLFFHPSYIKKINTSTQKRQRANLSLRQHILVYEAFLNKVSYKKWVEMCRTNNIPSNAFFINSETHSVHHKNLIPNDNRIENLEYTTINNHCFTHGKNGGFTHMDGGKTWRGGEIVFIPKIEKIVSIEDAGVIDVYDIVMEDPYRNFVANGIVVHNCGKTAQSIAYVKHMNFDRTLVVCPASVKFSWENEIKKWTNLSSAIIDGKTDLSKIDASINFWIINYDLLKKNFGQLSKIRFSSAISDESHLLKNTSTIRTKAFRALSRNIPSVILLSGTPLLSRPSELFSLLNIIDPNTWDNWYNFARKYCDLKQTRWGLDSSGASNTEELHARIKGYFIRRNKSEVLKELPPKNFINMPVELDDEIINEYTTAAKDLATYLRRYSGKQPPEITKSLAAEKLTQLNVLRNLSALGKIKTAIELIDSIVDSEEKVLVFSSFNEPLEKLKVHYGDKAVILTGKTPVNEREQIVNSFQKDSKVQIFLGGYKSAGVGITLTAASSFLGLDYPWNPADLQQSIDRLHRPGQFAESVNIYQLVAKDTIDEDIKETLDRKQDIFDQVIDGKISESIGREAMDLAVDRILKDY